MSTYDLTSSIPAASSLTEGDILNCPYSGAAITITLPKGKFLLECWGAEGGNRTTAGKAGKGGYSKGALTLTADSTTLYLYAGGSGDTGGTGGGFNGGGQRSTYNGGGGGSDVRIGQDSYYARVIVAGGGGSCGAAAQAGGAGGGESGEAVTGGYGSGGYEGKQNGNGAGSVSTSTTSNQGGFGFGGYGSYRKSGYGGAGGGGWYGGCGTYPDSSGDDDRGGGGGSGYVYTSDTASNYPSGCLLTSVYYLTGASTTIGTSPFTDYDGTTVTGHAGNGAVRITVIDAGKPAPPTDVTVTITDTRKATMTWTLSTTTGITDYRIKLYLGSTALLTTTIASTRTSYSYTASEAGTYTFSIESVKSSKYSDAVTTSFAIVGPSSPTNLTYELQGRSAKLSWDPSETEGATYILTGKKAGTIYLTQALEDTTYYAAIEPASYSFSVVAVLNTIQSAASNTVSFTIESSNNPTNLNGSIDQNGVATIIWEPSTSTNVLGYKIYMTQPSEMHIGTSPYGMPNFEFPFENNGLTINDLTEHYTWRIYANAPFPSGRFTVPETDCAFMNDIYSMSSTFEVSDSSPAGDLAILFDGDIVATWNEGDERFIWEDSSIDKQVAVNGYFEIYFTGEAPSGTLLEWLKINAYEPGAVTLVNTIEFSTWTEYAFKYQLQPRISYTLAIVSYNATYENPIVTNTPKISMSYTTSIDFTSIAIKPNPVYTGELFQLSAGIEETMIPTIVVDMATDM